MPPEIWKICQNVKICKWEEGKRGNYENEEVHHMKQKATPNKTPNKKNNQHITS
jgi:hypothetical protein